MADLEEVSAHIKKAMAKLSFVGNPNFTNRIDASPGFDSERRGAMASGAWGEHQNT